jgi:hypothetical protein
MFLSHGVLKYFPIEGLEHNTAWLILQCSPDLCLYYCWFIQKRFGIKLQQQLYKSHISVIRGEVITPNSIDKWNAYQGNIIKFHYSNLICTNGKYWWLDIYSPCLISIRQELGLDPQPEYNLHLTIGVGYS